MEKESISIFENPIVTSIISILVSVLTAYFTSIIMTRRELRKNLAEHFQKERIGKVIDELFVWVEKFNKVPTPKDAEDEKDVTDFSNSYLEFNSWITKNIANINSIDKELAVKVCSLRDETKKYLSNETSTTNNDINNQYKLILEKLSDLVKKLIQIQEKIMNP